MPPRKLDNPKPATLARRNQRAARQALEFQAMSQYMKRNAWTKFTFKEWLQQPTEYREHTHLFGKYGPQDLPILEQAVPGATLPPKAKKRSFSEKLPRPVDLFAREG